MRIIAGVWRGRTIYPPKGNKTRPTIDRVRESLMSSIASARGGFAGVHVLDAFAGSGALGIEALSRGAASAVFCEQDRDALAALRRNLEATGAEVRASGRTGAKPRRDARFAAPVFMSDADSPVQEPGSARSVPLAIVRKGDVLARPPIAPPQPYGIVFLDPPYALECDRVVALLDALGFAHALADDVLVSYEHALANPLPDMLGAEGCRLVRLQSKRYGETAIDIYGKEER